MPLRSPSKRSAGAAKSLPAIPAGVHMSTLHNGLTIIVQEDRSAPVVSAQAWCQTGSIHEGKWLGAGLSHVLEHMLFKGTSTRGAGRIDQEVQDAGGSMNAYTSFDRTVYHIDAPNTGARVAIDVLCDIMLHATIPADELVKELDVIRREMDMGQDDPGRRSSRRLFETAYTRSSYRYTIIGYPDIFNEIKRDDVVTYYHERYAPNNVFFVVVGDVETNAVVDQIKAAYSGAKARSIPPPYLPLEPRQTAPRVVVEEAAVELGHVHFSWHIPELRHPDVPILDVLAAVLGNGRSSRLFKSVREKQRLVHSIDAWTYSPGNPGMFGLSALVDANKFDAARDAMLEEVDHVRKSAVTADELAKAVKQFIAGTLASRKTMAGQAHDLGSNWLSANDLSFSERYLSAVKRTTPADLRRVASHYLSEENRTLYALLPAGARPVVSHVAELDRKANASKITLPNGLRLLLKEDHRLPFVEFRMFLRAGVLAETASNNGITSLMARMLIKGTGKRSAEQIATEIESVGGHIDAFGGNNSFGINAEVLSSDFTLGLNLVSDVLLNPSFPKKELEIERESQLAGIRAQRDHMLRSASLAMRKTMFGPAGYGLDSAGTESAVNALQVADLAAFHRQLTGPGNAVLAIFGDINPVKVEAAVRKAFRTWVAAPFRLPVLEKKHPLHGVKEALELRDKKQAVLVIGFPGGTLLGEDRCALDLLQESCSDLGSRLFQRIRDKLGLAYYVGAQNFLGLSPGYFAFYVGTEPSKIDLVRLELLEEARLLRDEGLTVEELKRAKAKLVGQKKISRQDLGGLASAMALDELYGLGFDHSDHDDANYEAVTLNQIKSVARKYLRPDAFVVAVARPE
ncbi:MAG: insulinase family protein [Opitutaceae bacterium]|nr:insulinase family protein [Verrucomicrobiales bacterium]